jgi:hypothetical protein
VVKEEPRVFQALLHYMYYFTYDDSSNGSGRNQYKPPAVFAATVYRLASEYKIKLLKELVAGSFEWICNTRDRSFIEVVRYINQYLCHVDSVLWDIALSKMREDIDFLLGQDTFENLLWNFDRLRSDLFEPQKKALLPATSPALSDPLSIGSKAPKLTPDVVFELGDGLAQTSLTDRGETAKKRPHRDEVIRSASKRAQG